MTLLLAVVLLVNAVFNIAVWPTFLRRVAKDTRARDSSGRLTPFLIVHIVLVSAALLIAALSGIVAVVALTAL